MTLMTLTPCKKIGEVEAMRLKIEVMAKKYYEMCAASNGIVNVSSSKLPEDMVVCLMIDVCNKDLREHLELSTKNMERLEGRS